MEILLTGQDKTTDHFPVRHDESTVVIILIVNDDQSAVISDSTPTAAAAGPAGLWPGHDRLQDHVPRPRLRRHRGCSQVSDSVLPQQCCGSGSGIRCLFDPWTRIRNRFFPVPGSRIPSPYFLELSDKFLCKKFYNSLKTGLNFFLKLLKNKIIYNFVKFVATKKRFDKKFVFTPPFS